MAGSWVENVVPFQVDGCLTTPQARVEVRVYDSVADDKSITFERQTSIGMVLAGKPIHARYPKEVALSDFQSVGSLIVRPRGVPWEVVMPGGHVRTVVCSFDGDWLDHIFGTKPEISSHALDECLHFQDTLISQNVSVLYNEIRNPGFASEILSEAVTTSIAVQLRRRLSRRADPDNQDGRLRDGHLKRIDTYLIETSDHLPTVGEIASLCDMSSRHLLRLFQRRMGVSLSSYIARKQFDKAKKFLSEDHLALKEISYRLGFSSPCSFTRAFTKFAGETPSAHRRRLMQFKA
jgi:AraC family transcriptional regulator